MKFVIGLCPRIYAAYFSLAEYIGWALPLFTKGKKRPLSLRSPGGAAQTFGGKGPDPLT